MADVFSKKKRSQIMRLVKSNHNKSTELKLIKFFKANHIKKWRRNYKLYGKPDFAFPSLRTVIFVDGCFWHGHSCRNTKPKANKDYWFSKIERNKKRDNEVIHHLSLMGWSVIRLWECELQNEKFLLKRLEKLKSL